PVVHAVDGTPIQPPQELVDQFHQPITINGPAGSTALVISDVMDANTNARFVTLDPTSIAGLGETQANAPQPSIAFSGLASMTVRLGCGGGQFRIRDTFASTSPLTLDASRTGSETVTVLASHAPLVLTGGGGTDKLVFDAHTQTAPMTTPQLVQAGTALDLKG